ncbi:ATP-binding protein [Streptomyces sp. NPDC051954]|uniref:sensor histidine kinase n=1 Tax=Streptomyces sp. NPDC051954 TaxID=3155524 RepID=UPI003449C550
MPTSFRIGAHFLIALRYALLLSSASSSLSTFSQRGLERREFVDLTAIVRERLPDAGPDVEARLDPAPVLGDPQLIERLVVNLTDNAVRHNLPPGEGGWVRVWTGVDGAGRPGLRIENRGRVIPADRAAGLFQPFRRLGPERVRRRDGLGLGMSIVAAVVAAHGGRVLARTRPQGGLTVGVGFPAPTLTLTPYAVDVMDVQKERQGVGSL